jgi:sporulation protein YlmC with PRC-barrel domain
MLLFSTTELLKYKVQGTEKTIGDVSGFLFNRTTWCIDYIIAKGGGLHGEIVIPTDRLVTFDNYYKIVSTSLSEEEIEQLPSPMRTWVHNRKDDKPSISYWRIGNFPRFLSWLNRLRIFKHYRKRQSISQTEHIISPQLSNTREVLEYRVMDQGSKVGEVEDLIIDTNNWTLRYLIVSRLKKSTAIPTEWISRVAPSRKTIKLKLNQDVIYDSPYVVE